jgi:hypothetical protein
MLQEYQTSSEHPTDRLQILVNFKDFDKYYVILKILINIMCDEQERNEFRNKWD